MLVAHAEQDGVWTVEGGMYRLAQALASLAERKGVKISLPMRRAQHRRETGQSARTDARRRRMAAVRSRDLQWRCRRNRRWPSRSECRARSTADRPAASLAVRRDLDRDWRRRRASRSRVTTCFSRAITAPSSTTSSCAASRPSEPTVYVCAQDRDDERPACARRRAASHPDQCATERRLQRRLGDRAMPRSNLPATGAMRADGERSSGTTARTRTPQDFDWEYPATGGALYGQASHGWMASFRRPGARSRIAGLYLAGGSAHPGPGVPMAALSGRLAAQALMQDLASTARSRKTAMRGGMSTH